jgi:hypothetical protein
VPIKIFGDSQFSLSVAGQPSIRRTKIELAPYRKNLAFNLTGAAIYSEAES